MKDIHILIYLFCILFVVGCHKDKPNITAQDLKGSWSCVAEENHASVIRGFWNNDGNLVFKFVKQFFEHEPVFVNYSIRNNQAKIVFRLIPYDQSITSKGKLKFVLQRTDKNIFQGQMFQPGENPKVVTFKKYGDYMNTKPFEGTWSHSPKIAGKKRIHILRCSKDDTGRLRFSFLKQYYSYEPVFTEYSVRDNQIEIKFKLTTYASGYDSKYSIKYILKPEEGSLVGQLHESWREPVDVTLIPTPKEVYLKNSV